MNKKFSELLANYQMTITGNNAYGIINGFETNVSVNPIDNVTPFTLHFSFYITDEGRQNVDRELRNAKIKFLKYKFTMYGLIIGMNDMTSGALIKRLPEVIDQVCSILNQNDARGSEYCPVCGEPLDMATAEKRKIDGLMITLDQECIANINAVIKEENKDFANAPNNYLKGFLGALVGGLAGAGVAIILYLIGFISSLSAFAAVILGAYLYQKFNGKPNKGMIVIVTLTTVVFMILSVFVVYIIEAGQVMRDLNIPISGAEAFFECMKDSEFVGYFIGDLALTLLFTAIGIVYQIVAMFKQVKRKNSI